MSKGPFLNHSVVAILYIANCTFYVFYFMQKSQSLSNILYAIHTATNDQWGNC